jgi:sensor histidine kinase regulating citrate/malate metabolism
MGKYIVERDRRVIWGVGLLLVILLILDWFVVRQIRRESQQMKNQDIHQSVVPEKGN